MKETILLAQEDVGIFLRGHQTCWNRLILSKSVIDVFVPGRKIFWSFTGQHWGECCPLPSQENNRVNCLNYLVVKTKRKSTQRNSKVTSDLQNEDDLKNEDKLKNEDDLKNGYAFCAL